MEFVGKGIFPLNKCSSEIILAEDVQDNRHIYVLVNFILVYVFMKLLERVLVKLYYLFQN